MATGEQPSPLKSKKISSSSSRTRNDSDAQWLLIPNNLELGARAKPSKKQRNKEKHRHFQKENLSSSSEVADGLSCKTRSTYHAFPRVKSNTATWLKDQFINEEKSKRGAYDSEEVFSDPDFPQPHLQNVHFPTNQVFPDVENQEHQTPPSRGAENENVKSVKDELKKKETAMVCEILSHIQEFISEAESSWQKLDLSDEPVIKDAFVKLKNAVKDVEGSRENKLALHHMAAENGFANGVSPSSSTSRVSNSKENIVNRDSSGNTAICNDDDQDKCNHHHEAKVSDERTESLSSDDCAITDVGERVAAVQWERRKLKNKLVELQEEKKIKDELLRELYYLKDAANTVTATGGAQLQKAKDKKKKKLGKLQSPSQHLKMAKGVPTEDSQNLVMDSDAPITQLGSRHTRSSTSVKRDNVRKEQNSSFPARRHYEAEGRANEDPDIPAAPAPAVSPALDNPEIQEKIRKLKVAQQHVKVIKDIVVSILETRKSGTLIPVDQLRLLTPMQKIDQYFSDEESGEESELDKDFPMAVHLSSSEPAATNVKEVCCEGLKPSLLDVESHKPEEPQEITTDNLETAVGKKDDLTKLQSQFQQLMQIFPSSDRKNDDPVRSSGEGAYTQKKNPSRNVVPENVPKIHSLRTVPHQDNLQLTRQNIVTMESQNQNSNSNLHNRDCNSVKKDNINNLSGKMGKLSIQNSMNSSYPDVLTASNNNMDTMSTFSYELNQNHSLPNEVERKTILDILKRDKKKQKQYDRNQDSKMCCNSSIDSEPLEGSNSALAMDGTTLAAWGGSSTQENFEDENEEPAESLEEQDDEESVSVFDKGSLRGHRSTTQYSGQFSNMQQYIESVTNIPEKRQRNFHHPAYNGNPNPPAMSEYHQHPAQVLKTSRRPIPSPNTSAGLPRDLRDNSSCVGDTAEHCNQRLSSKFIQQLKNHVDQLNTLCQNHMFHDRPQVAAVNSHPTQGYGHIPNTCTSLQPAPEIALPCNQQLLLCLSQCYHALYMQQLEIQHFQRCLWHNIDGENSHQQNNLNARNGHEEPSFRPYSVPTWSNPFNPSSHFPPDQISPSTYFQMPMKSFASHSGGSYATASGTPPARAVIHPTSQNNVSSQETLNNQVPPRTRANNFWDNFRSYSRQNLLSTSNNTKRNENVGSLVTPQVRQVYPLVTNESLNRTADISNTCCNTSSFSEYNRPAPNPDIHDAVNFSKKAKSNAPVAAASSSNSFQKKDVPTNVNSCSLRSMRSSRCHRLNLDPTLVQPTCNSSSTNLIQPQPPVQDISKVASFNPSSQMSVSQSAHEASVSNAASEVSSVLSGEHKSDFLIGLFHEAQGLKSDVLRQKALRMIRDLAMSERHDSDDISQAKVQNDLPVPSSKTESGSSFLNQSYSKQPLEVIPSPDVSDSDKMLYALSSESASGNIQNLPTAAILPLSKHCTPRTVSTGAVRKKPKILTTCLSEPVSNGLASSHDSGGSTADSIDPPAVMSSNKTIEDIPGFVTEKVLSDLVSMLPSLKRRLLRDGCSQTFWTFINDYLNDSLRTHLFFCNINLSRKSLIHLRQTVYLFISLFSGITLSDFDSDFLKYVEEFIYENITCFIASGQFAPVPSSLDEENCSLEMEDKMQELCGKMPGKSVEPVSIKMTARMPEEPVESINMKMLPRTSEDHIESMMVKMASVPPEKSINFFSQCGSVAQQNLQNFSNYNNFIHDPLELSNISPDPELEHISPEPELALISPEPEFRHISPEPEFRHISPEPEFRHISPEPELRLPEPELEHFEDLRCDCNPEAEIEPEVEIGTEADLAEADQSPGQQGTVGDGLPTPENWSLDHDAVLIHRNANSAGAIVMMNGEDNRGIEDSSEGAAGVQICSEACLDQDAILDDIPTKLCPSEEELPQQFKDEQAVQLPSDDNTHSDFISENNGDGGPANLR